MRVSKREYIPLKGIVNPFVRERLNGGSDGTPSRGAPPTSRRRLARAAANAKGSGAAEPERGRHAKDTAR